LQHQRRELLSGELEEKVRREPLAVAPHLLVEAADVDSGFGD